MAGLTVLIGPLSHVCATLSWSSVFHRGASGHTVWLRAALIPHAMHLDSAVGRIGHVHGHDTTNEAVGARDQRPPSLGLGRIIIALFWLLGAWILVTAILDLFHAQGQPWGPRIVALLAGIDYLIAATALTHNGRRMRLVGWVTISLFRLFCGSPRSAWMSSILRVQRGPALASTSTTCPLSCRSSA